VQIWSEPHYSYYTVGAVLDGNGVVHTVGGENKYLGRETSSDEPADEYWPINNPDEDGYKITGFVEAPMYGKTGLVT